MTLPRFATITILVGILVVCGALPVPVSAKLAPFDGIGGPGGAPFHLDCGEYGLLIGISGRSGIVIDQIGGLCVKIDPISGVWVGGAYETAHYGGTGGQPFNKRCPVGQALWGLEGSVNYFDGTPVVGSINIKCVDIGVHPERVGATIKGTRLIDYYGDPDPLKTQVEQDYCDTPHVGTDIHREPRVWNPIGIALEGRSGLFVDRVHIVCGSLPADTQGYRVQFKPSSNITALEGTPLQISWRASGVKPELTPNLQYEWILKDLTHGRSSSLTLPGSGSIGLGEQPTTVQNACIYAAQPCTSSWFGSSSFSSVTFTRLPVAAYELELAVRPTGGTETKRSVKFEIRPNLIVSLTFSVQNPRAGAPTTGTVTMEGPAPPQGRMLYLSSSNPDLVPAPPSFRIPGGASSGTFTLQTNGKPGSAGQATILVSTHPPIATKFSTGVQSSILSRGLEESTEHAQSSEQPEGRSEPDPTSATTTQESSADVESVQQGEVAERGISSIQRARPSTGIQSAIVRPPTAPSPIVTLPHAQPDAITSHAKPSSPVGPVAVDRLSLPSATKSAVLTVQLPFGTQLPDK